MFQERHYREKTRCDGLVRYNVRIKESDLLIHTVGDFSAVSTQYLDKIRLDLETYIKANPFFAASFEPLNVDPNAPLIVKKMSDAAYASGVGPMAAVAGAISELMGIMLLTLSSEVLIENGGDNFLSSSKERMVGIYAGNSPLSNKVALRIKPNAMPIGICTSSATVGHSISLGKTDACVVASKSAALADAAATAIGNIVHSSSDIEKGLEKARGIPGVIGAVIIVGERLGVCGDLELRHTDLA